MVHELSMLPKLGATRIAALKASGQLFAPDTFRPMAGALKDRTSGVIYFMGTYHGES